MINRKEFKLTLLAKTKKDPNLINSIDTIVTGIGAELDKFSDTSANLLLSAATPSYASLFVYQPKHIDIKQVMAEVISIREQSGIDLTDDVRKAIYKGLANISTEYLGDICGTSNAQELMDLIKNRNINAVPISMSKMEVLLKKIEDNESLQQIIKLLLQVDPIYQGFASDDKYKKIFPDLVETSQQEPYENSLNLDFLKPVLNLVVKIYENTFKSDNDDSENNMNNGM